MVLDPETFPLTRLRFLVNPTVRALGGCLGGVVLIVLEEV
jgi:hypothetical protein